MSGFNLLNMALKIFGIFILLFKLTSESFVKGKFGIQLRVKPRIVHFWCGINSHDIFVRTFIPTKISNADKQKIEANSKQRCR
jgi:hypothetical protein